MSSERDELQMAVARALDDVPGVQAALLFGSHAKETARPDSDVDVAVLLDAAPDTSGRTARMRELIEALGQEIAADRIDLVILNDAPPKLAFRALSEGVVALERDAVALHRFRVRTYSRHADYQPIERFFREATRKRLLKEASLA